MVFVFLLPQSMYLYDKAFWYSWIVRLNDVSLTNIYQFSDVNYPPFYLYFLTAFGKIFTTPELIWQNIQLLKLIPLVFDFASIYLIIKMFQKLNIQGSRAFFILFNIAFLYNTLFWGQVDGIYVFFVLFSMLLALYKRPTLSLLVFLIALNVKLQAIIFAPLVLILVIPAILKDKGIILRAFLFGICMQIIMFLPFIIDGKIPQILNVIANSTGFYPQISMNAYNFWFLVLGPAFVETSDLQVPLLFSYRIWGIILFAGSSILALLPIIKQIREALKTKHHLGLNKAFVATAFLTAGVISLLFFFFNTQMHERYVHAAIIMIGIYALIKNRYVAYILISLAYFLNLERFLQYLDNVNHMLPFFGSRFVALLYLIGIIICFGYLYDQFIKAKLVPVFSLFLSKVRKSKRNNHNRKN
jgi:Gpi18-like mannosyltransferase